MPLLACPECQRDVSDRASACPHCGCPTEAVALVRVAEPPRKARVVDNRPFRCPHCRSEDVLLCPTAYSHGRAEGRVSNGNGTVVVSVTEFASRAGPPRTYLQYGFGTLAAGVVGAFLLNGTPLLFLASLGLALVGLILLVCLLVRLPSYFRAYAEWEDSWICRRCSTIF